MGTEVTDGPTAATHAQGAIVHTCQGNGLRPCSPSAMRARLGGVWQPRGCSSGKSEVELGMEVRRSPPVAGDDDNLGAWTVRLRKSSWNGGKIGKRVGTRTRCLMSGTVYGLVTASLRYTRRCSSRKV